MFYLRASVRLAFDMQSLYGHVSECFEGLGGIDVAECLIATAIELEAEFAKVSERRGFPLNGDASLGAGVAADWSRLLTPKQQMRLDKLSATWQRKYGSRPEDCNHCVLNLDSNRGQTMGADGAIPTLTRKSHILWLPFYRRWLLPSELAAASGFPVTSALADSLGLPQDLNEYAVGQVGNVMHLANVGCVLGVALASLRLL